MNDILKNEIMTLIDSHDFNDEFMIFKSAPENTAAYLKENEKNVKNNKGVLINQGLLNLFEKIKELIYLKKNIDIDLQTISDKYFESYDRHLVADYILKEI